MKQSDLPKLAAPFPKSDVHWRAQTVTKDGTRALALAYLDARNVQDRLDEVCSPEGWQTRHRDAGNGKLACEIGILVHDQWIWKSDGAGATDIEGDKGAFSDSLKRAAVSWGVGRYLYSMENTWVPCKSWKGNDGKFRFDSFTDDPWNHVKRKDGPAEPVVGETPKTKLQQHLREFDTQLRGCVDASELDGLLESYKPHLQQCERDLPSWWITKHGSDALGIRDRIEKRKRELADPDNPHSYAAE